MDANNAYRAAHERAACHLRRIEALLAEHAQRQAATPENWAHVGQMKLIESELAELADLFDRPTTKETHT
jgi:hypothetical protein